LTKANPCGFVPQLHCHDASLKMQCIVGDVCAQHVHCTT
jgi:hypothetical protein